MNIMNIIYYYYCENYYRKREQRTLSIVRNPSRQTLTIQNYLRNWESVRMQMLVTTSDPQKTNLVT
jgi:hypothetical protein